MALAVVAGKIDPAAASATLSPARQALAKHSAELAKLAGEVERAGRPPARLRAELIMVDERLKAAEADRARVEAGYAATIAEAAKAGAATPLPKPPELEKSQAGSPRDRLAKAAIERALADCAAEMAAATAALRDAEVALDPLTLAVMIEEFDVAVQAWRLAHEHFSAADNQLRGLLDAIGAYGRARSPGQGHLWLQERERMGILAGKLPATPTGDFRINAAKWSALLDQLASDPQATCR
jgi:hypothetical protein